MFIHYHSFKSNFPQIQDLRTHTIFSYTIKFFLFNQIYPTKVIIIKFFTSTTIFTSPPIPIWPFKKKIKFFSFKPSHSNFANSKPTIQVSPAKSRFFYQNSTHLHSIISFSPIQIFLSQDHQFKLFRSCFSRQSPLIQVFSSIHSIKFFSFIDVLHTQSSFSFFMFFSPKPAQFKNLAQLKFCPPNQVLITKRNQVFPIQSSFSHAFKFFYLKTSNSSLAGKSGFFYQNFTQ